MRFALGETTVTRWVLRYRDGRQFGSAKKRGGTPARITAADVEAVVTQLGDPPAGEITATYNGTQRGRARVHVSTMKRALHRCSYVVKNNAAGRWRRTDQRSRPSAVYPELGSTVATMRATAGA